MIKLVETINHFVNKRIEGNVDVDPEYFSSDDLEAFKTGAHFHLYRKMGAHFHHYKEENGVYFAVWAPHAKDSRGRWQNNRPLLHL